MASGGALGRRGERRLQGATLISVPPFLSSTSSWAALVAIGLLCLSLPDVFAVLFDDVLVIDVGRVVGTGAAVDVVLETVRSADRVIAGTTEQVVDTEPAVYAVVTGPATYLVVTTAAVAIVVASQTHDRVCGTESIDPAQLIGACELILPKSAPYVLASATPLSTISPTNNALPSRTIRRRMSITSFTYSGAAKTLFMPAPVS
jgi:hypothetical protein